MSLALAVFSEVLCSILIILGLFTRFAAIPLIVTMLVAAFIVHSNDGFKKQELAILYAVLYLVMLVMGAGNFPWINIWAGHQPLKGVIKNDKLNSYWRFIW